MSIAYTVLRKAGRKTASISVSPENVVSITVPAGLDDAAIEAIVRRKRNWILRKIAFNREVRFPHKPKEYVSGEAFQYMGRNYRLKVVPGEGVELKAGRLCVGVPPPDLQGEARSEHVRRELEGWYREHAREKLSQRARMHAGRMGLEIGDVGVRDYRRQWGSCHQDGTVWFHWKVIQAPLRIIDYVLIHELVHLVHRNHSPSFWKVLKLYLPDYAESKEWLRVNGGLLGV